MVSAEIDVRAAEKPNTGYGWVVLGVVFLAGLCAPANMAKVTTLAPIMMEVFSIGPGLIGWVIALFYVLGFVMSFPTAGLANKFGIKNIVIASLVLSIVGGVIGAFSTSLPLFMVSRVLEGAGMGIMGTIGIPAISPWFAPSKQGLPMGIWGMWVSVPMFVGPIVYTAIYEQTGAWQPVWYFTIALSVVALVVFAIFYKNPTYRFNEDEQAVALDVAQGIELEKPSIKRALKLPLVWVLAVVILLDNAGFMAVQGFLTTYVYDYLGVSLGVAAALVSAAAIIGAVMSPVAGIVSDKIRSRRVVLLVSYVCACVYMWFVFDAEGLGLAIYVPVVVLMGIACGAAGSMQWAICGERVAPELQSGAMGVLAFAQNLGMFFGAAFFGGIVEAMGGDWTFASHAILLPLYVIIIVIVLFNWKKLP